jgi:hypothetical protein
LKKFAHRTYWHYGIVLHTGDVLFEDGTYENWSESLRGKVVDGYISQAILFSLRRKASVHLGQSLTDDYYLLAVCQAPTAPPRMGTDAYRIASARLQCLTHDMDDRTIAGSASLNVCLVYAMLGVLPHLLWPLILMNHNSSATTVVGYFDESISESFVRAVWPNKKPEEQNYKKGFNFDDCRYYLQHLRKNGYINSYYYLRVIINFGHMMNIMKDLEKDEVRRFLATGYTVRTKADTNKIEQLLSTASTSSLSETALYVDSNFHHNFSGVEHSIGILCTTAGCYVYDNLHTHVVLVTSSEGLLPFYQRLCKLERVYSFDIHV